MNRLAESGIRIIYADPAGNITAIVRGAELSDRVAISNAILKAKLAEQVGFETEAGDASVLGRLEMMGGEFCGNAARAYGYLRALEEYGRGKHDVLIRISGAAEPVRISADLDNGEAHAYMARPYELTRVFVNGNPHPVVRMEGIDHLIAYGRRVDELWGVHAIEAMKDKWNPEACGVMFVSEAGDLTPLVYVRDTDSLVWESSCGSGSIAAAYYLYEQYGQNSYAFKEPGGVLEVETGENSVLMGGRLEISQ